MDWVLHLLEGDRSPLGFKRLREPSARVVEFLASHRDLPISEQAAQHGPLGTYVPNMADTGNRISVFASFLFLDNLLAKAPNSRIGIVGSGQAFGSTLEGRIATGLRQLVDDFRLPFKVSTRGELPHGTSLQLTDYWPYLSPPSRAGEPGEAQMYRALGRGHLIQPDVIVWRDRDITFTRVAGAETRPFAFTTGQLFACISGKATIRSDRSQSSRYEGTALVRWRRARPPHIVVVTAEPLPSRLGSLAWGLGDLDCVYHVDIAALYQAVTQAQAECGTRGASGSAEELKDLIEHARLKDLSQLFEDLFSEVLPADG